MKYLNDVKTQELITENKTRLAKKATQYVEMPEATAATSGQIVQYIGTTTSSYTQGDFYKGTYDSIEGGAWEKLTYTKSEVDAAISSAGHFVVVVELPTTNIRTNVIYLVPKVSNITGYYDGTENDPVYVGTGTEQVPAYDKYEYDSTLEIYIFSEAIIGNDAETIKGYIDASTYSEVTVSAESRESNNIKTEYINLDSTVNGWEKIGETQIDLSDYVRFSDLTPITTAELTAMWNGTWNNG